MNKAQDLFELEELGVSNPGLKQPRDTAALREEEKLLFITGRRNVAASTTDERMQSLSY